LKPEKKLLKELKFKQTLSLSKLKEQLPKKEQELKHKLLHRENWFKKIITEENKMLKMHHVPQGLLLKKEKPELKHN